MSRQVRVATVAQRRCGASTIADNRQHICRLIEQAAAQKPDII